MSIEKLASILNLSARETEILRFLSAGMSVEVIAYLLRVSPNVVKHRIATMRRKASEKTGYTKN